MLKFFKVHTKVPDIVVGHSRRTKPNHIDYPKIITGEESSTHFPTIEMTPVAKKISLPEIYTGSIGTGS